MTPLHIRLAVHYRCHPYPYSQYETPAHANSPAVRRYTADLVRAGLIVPRVPDGPEVPEHSRNTSDYEPTEGLRMYLDALEAVPLPKLREAWIHPMLKPRTA